METMITQLTKVALYIEQGGQYFEARVLFFRHVTHFYTGGSFLDVSFCIQNSKFLRRDHYESIVLSYSISKC